MIAHRRDRRRRVSGVPPSRRRPPGLAAACEGVPVLDEQTAVVTGAGRGIGRAVAVALARDGADVVLASRSPTELAQAAAEVAKAAGAAGRSEVEAPLVVPTDVRDPAQ